MIPLFVFLLACAAVYLGTIDAAFSALMRLSLRLLAERSARPGALGEYLDDPVLLFAPVRLLLAIVTAMATVLLARGIGAVRAAADRHDRRQRGALHRALPGRAAAAARHRRSRACTRGAAAVVPAGRPPAAADCELDGTRGAHAEGVAIRAAPEEPPADADEVTRAYLDTAEEEGIIEGEERRLLQSIVDFGDTLVREIMTPRPDIVAIRDDATVGDLLALFREQEYSRFPVYKDNLDNIAGLRLREGPGEVPAAGRLDADRARFCGPPSSSPRASGCRNS